MCGCTAWSLSFFVSNKDKRISKLISCLTKTPRVPWVTSPVHKGEGRGRHSSIFFSFSRPQTPCCQCNQSCLPTRLGCKYMFVNFSTRAYLQHIKLRSIMMSIISAPTLSKWSTHGRLGTKPSAFFPNRQRFTAEALPCQETTSLRYTYHGIETGKELV